jgi:fatty-acyl-CoA synthase
VVSPQSAAGPADLKNSTLSSVLDEYSNRSPDKVCIHLLQSTRPAIAITYAQLRDRSVCIAAELKLRGVQRGDVVIIILNHSQELINAFFGAALAGAIPAIMPFLTEKLSPDQYRRSLSALLDITRPGAVITYKEFESEVEQAAAGIASAPAIILADDIHLSHCDPPDDIDGIYSDPDEIAVLQHSSGTTGLQKGVALSHRAVFNQLHSYAQSIRLNPQDVIVSWLPLYHDMGLIAGFLLPVMLGVPLVLMSPFDWVRAPYRLLQAISEYRGTLCWLPNFAYNFCAQKIRESELENVDLSSWRAVINCSEPMYWDSHEMFLNRFRPYGLRDTALTTCYAMAENVFAVTQGGIQSPVLIESIDRTALTTGKADKIAQDNSNGVKMLSAGKSLDNTTLRVVDAQGNSLPERSVGEIAIKSDCMLTGYYNRPDLTEQAFIDGWYMTGDLGYLAGDELFITGRKKDLIIVGGKNVYPQDIENLAGQVEGVHPGRVAAFGVYNDRAGTEDVVVIAEVDSLDEATGIEISDQVRRQVTRGSDIALRQVRIVKRGWLVKTSSGKVARAANREKYLSELLGSTTPSDGD